ncbi:MAG: gliding motility protein GldM [Bacteroidales bacterium]|nr:gliding motility protein GldM [Bacteroidales bacterium]
MAGYKETPRQKMIGMLYLVLTALLALNVSKEILEAFVVVNETMENTNQNFSQKLDASYNKFKAQYLMAPDKVGPYWEKAQAAQTLSENLINYIDSLKFGVVAETERLQTIQEAGNVKLADAARKDNYDTPTQYFIGQSQDGTNCRAATLRHRIDSYREEMLNLVDPKYRNVIQIGLKTDGPYYNAQGREQNWQMHNFYRTILAATVTILNELKAEVLNAEFDVVNNLMASITAEDWKFDEIKAKVIPKSNYVFIGEEYQAEILVAAYDTKQNPDVYYLFGADTLTPGNFRSATPLSGTEGVVILKLPATSEGLKRFAGIIKIISPLGDTMSFHFKDEYIVARPALTISPTKMNVFYIGVENPVSITVPGGPERVIPSISAGKIRPDGANWIVYDLPKGVNEAVITVNAIFSGKSKSMGSSPFRLKTVPDPIATIGGRSDGMVSKSILLAAPYLVAEMPAWFDFDLRFTVISYTFVTDNAGYISETPVQGNRLTPDITRIIQDAKKNKRIWFEDIVVRGPDGDRNISAISLKIN